MLPNLITPKLGLLLIVLACVAATATASTAATQRMTREVLRDKIRGGWAGQMIGVAYGAPTEFQSNAKINEAELNWTSTMLENSIHQDDLYVEMTFARVMDEIGLDATCEQYGEALKHSEYDLWHANAGARRLLNQGIKAPMSGHPQYNLHANDIDFQIEADFIGLMCPGLPQESNKYCDRVGRVMNYGDGLYGGMFVCGMYAAAFFEHDPRKVVEAGLACIPPDSQYALLIRDLLEWSAAEPGDWRKVWHQVEAKWDRDDQCPEAAFVPFNIEAKLNGAYIAFGLLYGGGDLAKTMEISTRCGQDSDCNPSSAAGVLGVMLGYDRIPDRFKAGLPALADRRFDYTTYSFNDIVRSTETRALEIVRLTGGAVADTDVTVETQPPVAPKLEQWNPGVPSERLKASDPSFTYATPWKAEDDSRISTKAGDEVVLKFKGVAVALVGKLDQDGGRAEVFVDGNKAGVADAYIVPRTHDNALWHTSGLPSGEHTLRLVALESSDARSTGRRLTIEGAIVYRAAE